MATMRVGVQVADGRRYAWLQTLIHRDGDITLETTSAAGARPYHQSVHPDGTTSIDTPEPRTPSHRPPRLPLHETGGLQRYGRLVPNLQLLRWGQTPPKKDSPQRRTLTLPASLFGQLLAAVAIDTYVVEPGRRDLLDAIARTYPVLARPLMVVDQCNPVIVIAAWGVPHGMPMNVDRLSLGYRVEVPPVPQAAAL